MTVRRRKFDSVRDRVIELHRSGLDNDQIAERLGVPKAYVRATINRWKTRTGQAA